MEYFEIGTTVIFIWCFVSIGMYIVTIGDRLLNIYAELIEIKGVLIELRNREML